MLEQSLLTELKEFVDRHLYEEELIVLKSADFYSERMISEEAIHNEIEDFVKSKLKPTFSQTLLHLIDKKGFKDSIVYKKAGIDRRVFSKIRSNSSYRPRKNTAISLALALELTQSETEELLGAAGYSLSESDTFDLVILFCIKKKIYQLQAVNEALNYFSLKPLAGVLE